MGCLGSNRVSLMQAKALPIVLSLGLSDQFSQLDSSPMSAGSSEVGGLRGERTVVELKSWGGHKTERTSPKCSSGEGLEGDPS